MPLKCNLHTVDDWERTVLKIEILSAIDRSWKSRTHEMNSFNHASTSRMYKSSRTFRFGNRDRKRKSETRLLITFRNHEHASLEFLQFAEHDVEHVEIRNHERTIPECPPRKLWKSRKSSPLSRYEIANSIVIFKVSYLGSRRDFSSFTAAFLLGIARFLTSSRSSWTSRVRN